MNVRYGFYLLMEYHVMLYSVSGCPLVYLVLSFFFSVLHCLKLQLVLLILWINICFKIS